MPSPLLLWATVAVGALALVIPYAGSLASAFGFVTLSWPVMLALVAIVAAYALATELVKVPFYKRKRR